jgi:hypothetical protein
MTFFLANGEYSCDKIEHFGTVDSLFGNNKAPLPIKMKEFCISTSGDTKLSNSQTLIALNNICDFNENLCNRIEKHTINVSSNVRYTTKDKYSKFVLHKTPPNLDYNKNNYNKSSLVKCTFDITTTDQNFGNYDGTQFRVFLTNDGKEHDIIPKAFCINQKYLKSGLPRENNFKGNKIFEQPLNASKETIIYLELYNLYPGHQGQAKTKLINLHIWNTQE